MAENSTGISHPHTQHGLKDTVHKMRKLRGKSYYHIYLCWQQVQSTVFLWSIFAVTEESRM